MITANEARKISSETLTEVEEDRILIINADIARLSKNRLFEVIYGKTYITSNMDKNLRNRGFIIRYRNNNCEISWY